MTELPLAPLPAPFDDCAGLIGHRPAGAVPLEAFLASAAFSAGVRSLERKYGPGDRRAAAGLWTQGFFNRLIRPYLAYGILADCWFDLAMERIGIRLSGEGTVAGFHLTTRSTGPCQAHLDHLLEQVDCLGVQFARLTGTSPRLHRSNAAYAFRRTLLLLSPPATASIAPLQRLTEAEKWTETEHFLGRLTLLEGSGSDARIVRRVCCLRYRLCGLARCASACPLPEAATAGSRPGTSSPDGGTQQFLRGRSGEQDAASSPADPPGQSALAPSARP